MSNKTRIARKAVRIRQARDEFWNAYGPDTYNVVELLVGGHSTHEVSDAVGLPVSNVAAFAANLTRGTYGTLVGRCNFR